MTIWIEYLTVPVLLTGLLRGIFGRAKIIYDVNHVSHRAQKLLALFGKRILNRYYEPIILEVCDEKIGCADLHYTFTNDLVKISENFTSSVLKKESQDVKTIARAHITVSLYQRARFIRQAEREIAKRGVDKGQVILLRRHPLNFLLKAYFQNANFKIDQSWSAESFFELLGLFLKNIASTSIAVFLPHKVSTNIVELKSALWIEYANNEDGSSIGRKQASWSFSFCGDLVDQAYYDVVFYNHRSDSKINDVDFKGTSLKWIDLKHDLRRIAPLSLRQVLHCFGVVLKYNPRTPLWWHFTYVVYYLQLMSLISIYKRYKVKVVVHYQESSVQSVLQRMALDVVGGILVSSPWSFFPFYQMPTHTFCNDVYFVWSSIHKEALERNKSVARHVLPSGIWIANPTILDTSTNIFLAKFEYVIAVFDSSAGPEYVASSKNLMDFWEMVVELLREKKSLGIVVKRKQYDSFADFDGHPGGVSVRQALESMADRILILDHNQSPQAAAVYAKLCVCLGVNSAGMVAAARGKKVIHWNNAQWQLNPAQRQRMSKIIYDSVLELKTAVIEAIGGDQEIGDIFASGISLDYFKDDKARSRIAAFVSDFLKYSTTLNDKQAALQKTIMEYKRNNRLSEPIFSKTDFYPAEIEGH